MPKKIDFSSVIGGKKKAGKASAKKTIVKSISGKKPAKKLIIKEKQPAAKTKKPAAEIKKPAVQAPAPKPTGAAPKLAEKGIFRKVIEKAREKKLEHDIKSFGKKPKEQRVKASEGFDFKQVTSQIKEKLSATETGPGFDQATVEKSLAGSKKPAPKQAMTKEEKIKKLTEKFPIHRVPTGIKGMDQLIEGGFEQGAAILIVGSAGTGKTLFGLQFLYYGAVNYNEPGIFISFEEEKDLLYKHSASFGWDFEALEKKGLFKVLEYKPHHVEKIMQEGGGTIKAQIRAMGAKRLVIDSITAYALLFKDEYAKRENILDFFDMLAKWGCTSIIISELPPKLAEIKEGSVGFLTDAIISLYYSKDQEKGIRVHSCEILKMRGTRHTNKLLALGFEKDGIVIYPEVEVF